MQTRLRTVVLAALAAAMAGCATQEVQLPADTSDKTYKTYAEAFDMQRCVNMGNSFDAPKDAPWGQPIDPADFAVIKSKGFDTVRIPVRWTDHQGAAPAYKIDPDFMAKVDTAVTAALAADLNVILNMHHNEEIVKTPVEAMPAYAAAWQQIAAHFEGAPQDLWFETLNEPFGELKGKLMRQAQSLGVATIRKIHPERVIILGGEEWSGIRTLYSNLEAPDDNIVYTFHYYDPFNFTHQKATWLGDSMPKEDRGWGSRTDRDELRAAGQTAVDFRSSTARPLFLGEFGANQGIPNKQRVKWAEAVRTEMENREIPWCLWSYSNTFELYDNESDTWDTDMLNALGVGD